jgi:hypothetical protein
MKIDEHLIFRNSVCWNGVEGSNKKVEESPYES